MAPETGAGPDLRDCEGGTGGRVLAGERERSSNNAIPENSQAPRDLVLAEIEHVEACLAFVRAEVCMIGTQLRAGRITPAQAQFAINNLSDPADILRRATQ
jgi:hypothetical protein